MRYLGIDGGGTKTSFCLIDESVNIISEYQSSGCYYPAAGKNGVIKILTEGIEACLKNAGADINITEIKTCCGLPSYGELDSLMSDLPEIQSRLPVSVKFCNDVEICHAGALNCKPGIAIIAGTGSIAYGYDEMGNKARSGGFGSEMNCDEGSAHCVGLRLIQKFTRQADFREERTLLYDEVKKALDLKSDIDIYSYMIETIKMERRIIAQFAVLAEQIARMGDKPCLDIYREAAYELFLPANAVKKQLEFTSAPVNVSYGGGLFKANDLIIPELNGLLQSRAMVLNKPEFPPVVGACLIAKNKKG